VRRCRAVVSGRVQGVWFRETTRRLAAARGVAGWVRNNPGGAVEAVFEGKPEAVEALLEFCRQGPDRAAVSGVDVREEDPEGLEGFRVL
jgi:acylphosphatase